MYDDFYKLKGKPFQLTPDHKFFFNSKGHNRAMAYLRYGLEQGEGFIVITGGIGTGKTTLVRNLFQEISNKDVMAAQLVTTQVDPDDMLRMVCASFGLAHEGLNKATLLHNLEAIARTRHAEGKQILLVVDEAQNLPARSVEELRMLSNFQVADKALVQTFLLGQEEFKRTLQSPGMEQFRQRIIASYHLEPLSADETEKYIKHRLQLVGWKNDPELTDEVFKKIFDFTNGVPRRINSICDRLMLYGCLEELHTLDDKAIDSVITELQQEVSYQQPNQTQLASVSEIHSSGNRAVAGGGISISPDVEMNAEELIYRIQDLEKEISNIKRTMQNEQKLLRKAILLQMDMDEFGDN
ncbi:XrtA/PEP-CTERM system-associated ATPase [Candidatus Endoriftia persephonae]|jgi:putative secretion ATPase (PEP-CTERM system associated)|uniref:General secretion pathway protein A n=4 Tax=Gammaproteobacteria TaxID=1236 RepID=G2FIB9_9GAMM|nr:XrtA/PEP-CTERM system-associated ATPase [Candidatus Endoriftia persephone]EGV52879.1 general secretion pathway protein A [endosymbiont of Riftia pachyptila (vent Ph05)]EGW53472.1 general secretion pathway protein A [endosymbiont of Tevnia jerichonana (vent Tica)]KRT56151.1 putative secretion ATPase, PEP-CTERM locus subfamily [endosymbiont of Ridgeia piscesae]KRT57558.1 putative secretion ATPase, PEP-CTERM locus subfamily [endosymbiont of Ridgeia piscesae]USF87587.1 XrtA-associated ATPase [C